MDLPSGMVHNMCLCVNQASMESILDSPMPSESSRRQRKKIPYVVAITPSASQPAAPSEAGDEEEEDDDDDAQGGEYFRGYFNVAVETLLTDLFAATADDTMDPDVLGSHVKDDEIWCNAFRYGIYRIDNTG
jgi:hypothetical protein